MSTAAFLAPIGEHLIEVPRALSRRPSLDELHDRGSLTICDADEERYLRLVEDWDGDRREYSVEEPSGLAGEDVLWRAIETRAPLSRVVELLNLHARYGGMPNVDPYTEA